MHDCHIYMHTVCCLSGNDTADAYIYMIPQQIDCVKAHLLEVGQVVAIHACMHVNLVPGTKVRICTKFEPTWHDIKYTKTYTATPKTPY
jgi:hypothetical protein